MNKKLIQLLTGLVFALSGSMAQAMIVTFAYAATESSGTLGGTVAGFFGYDDSISDTNPSSDQGFYPAAGFFNGTISGGLQAGVTFNRTNFAVQILNDQNLGSSFQDFFQINDFASGNFIAFGSSSPGSPTPPLNSDALASLSLISALLDLSSWSSLRELAVVDNSGLQLVYDLTSLRIAQVPEPGTVSLLAMGLFGLAYRRFKQRPS